jgi:hypothetical protein
MQRRRKTEKKKKAGKGKETRIDGNDGFLLD